MKLTFVDAKRKLRVQSYGFTLIELLVVISIIGLLLSIVLPALRKVKEQGRQVTCMNNMKQTNLAVQFYTGDFDNWYPSAYLYDSSRASYIAISQMLIEQKYLPSLSKKTMTGTTVAGYDALAKVFLNCPSTVTEGTVSRYTIGYNGSLLFGKDKPTAKTYSIKQPSIAWMWLDAKTTHASSYQVFITYCEERYISTYGFPEFRHNNHVNVSHCDGHASKLSKKDYDDRFAYDPAWGYDTSKWGGSFKSFWMGR